MAFTKYASLEKAEVLEVKGSPQHREASFDKLADFEDWRTEDGYLYARIRAISSRVNKNHDGWPSVELAGGSDIFNRVAGIKTGSVVLAADKDAKFGYSTFLGKPIFVDHHNSDPTRARGVIVDSKLHVEEDDDPYYKTAADNHKPATWVELLLEIDAKSFPKLAKAIIEGSQDPTKGIDGFSMGCDVRYSKCSHCGNKATTPDEYCEHIRLKGAEFPYLDTKTGKTTFKKSYEDCYEIGFFEISAVFDPADETALLREIRAHTAAENPPDFPVDLEGNPHGGATLGPCPNCNGDPYGCEACDYTGELSAKGGDGYLTPNRIGPDAVNQLAPEPDLDYYDPATSRRDLGPRRQGNFAKGAPDAGDDQYFGGKPGSAKKAYNAMVKQYGKEKAEEVYYATRNKHKTAEAPPPQVDELKMPEPVDTLREETVCPVCGSDMDDETCAVCGYTKPPDGFDNPDLTKANPEGDQGPEQQEQQEEHDPMFDGSMGPEQPNTSNPGITSHLNNDMSWEVSTSRTSYTQPGKETPAVPNAKPATDEPKKAEIKQDHSQPVTSHQVRTAEDFLAVADAQRRQMDQHTADAATGAPEAATPDKNIDVDGVGGIIEPSNEEASKADAQIDVVGVGTTGTSDVAADSTESVDQGDEHSKNIEEIPTKTFDNGTGVEKQIDGVTPQVYPAEGGVTSSWQVQALDSKPYPHEDGGLAGGPYVEGTQPVDPVGKADERVNVQEPTTSPENNSGETKTWSGTDGNKVYRQQDPVTNETLEGEDIVNLSPTTSSAHIFAAMKLADREVELGLTPVAEKYERAAELEKLSPEELSAESRVVARVKTAGLSKATKEAMRMPSMGRNASVEKEAKEEGPSEFVTDSALFLS